MQTKTSLFLCVSVCLALTTTSAFAQERPSRAEPAPLISSRCAIVWEPEGAITHYEKNADEHCLTGSTAKIMTIHGALWALRNGHISETVPIIYSQKAVGQDCRCIGDYDINRDSWPDGTSGIDIAQIGEVSTLDEALYGVAMSAAQPTVAVAELIGARYSLGTMTPPGSTDESTEREIHFVKDVMNPQAMAMGAQNTKFMNEHGGWEPLKPGVWSGRPYSSARDFVRMWDAMVRYDDRFLKYTGFDSYQYNSIIPVVPNQVSMSNTYVFNKSYAYYPHVEGDKSGGTTLPDKNEYTSWISGSTRLGRRLLVDVMEADVLEGVKRNAFTDTRILYHYAFTKIFKPKNVATFRTTAMAKDIAMDCMTSGFCVSAEINQANQIVLRVLRVDHATGAIFQLWEKPNRKTSGKFDPTSGYSEVEIIHLGDIDPLEANRRPVFVVAAKRRNGGVNGPGKVVLETWEFKNGQLTKLDDTDAHTGSANSIELSRVHHSSIRRAPKLPLSISLPVGGASGADTTIGSSTRTGDTTRRKPERSKPRQPSSSPQISIDIDQSKEDRSLLFVLARNVTTSGVVLVTWSVDANGALHREDHLNQNFTDVVQLVESGGDFPGFFAIVNYASSAAPQLRFYRVSELGTISRKEVASLEIGSSQFGMGYLQAIEGDPIVSISHGLSGATDQYFITEWQLTKAGFNQQSNMGPYEQKIDGSASALVRPGGVVAAIRAAADSSLTMMTIENDDRFISYGDDGPCRLLKMGETTVEGNGGEIVMRSMGTAKSKGVYASAMITNEQRIEFHAWTVGY